MNSNKAFIPAPGLVSPFILAVCTAFLLLFVQCGSTQHSIGVEFLEKGQYQRAVQAFVAELRRDSLNAEVWRDLGIALYKSGDPRAFVAFQKANRLDKDDGLTLFHLGYIREEAGDFQGAISYYSQFTRLSSFSEIRDDLEDRLVYLSRKQLEMEARRAVEIELSIDVSSIPPNSIAVLNFHNIGSNRSFDALQKGLADMIITDLANVKRLKVIERARMQELVKEIGFGESGLVDEGTAPRVGKLLGASTLVKGTFVDLQDKSLRIEGGIAHIQDGTFIAAKEISGDLDRFFRMEKDLVFSLVDKLGIRLSKEEREAILIIPTQSLTAFLSYSQGLDHEDRSNYGQARASYQRAIVADPKFNRARDRMQRAQRMERGGANKGKLEQKFAVGKPPGVKPGTQPGAQHGTPQGQPGQQAHQPQGQQNPSQSGVQGAGVASVQPQPGQGLQGPSSQAKPPGSAGVAKKPQGSVGPKGTAGLGKPGQPGMIGPAGQSGMAQRLQRSGFRVNAGHIPGRDFRNAPQERNGEQGFGGVKLIIEIPIPPR